MTIDEEGDSRDIKQAFTYEGEKLVKILEYKKDGNGNWIEFSKSEITYYAETATETYYFKKTAGWEADDKSVFVFFNDLLLNEYYYRFYPADSTWTEYSYYTYGYSGRKITSWTRNEYHGEWSEQKTRGEYTYQHNDLSQYFCYEYRNAAWYPVYKELFTYEGDHFVNWTRYKTDETTIWVNNA